MSGYSDYRTRLQSLALLTAPIFVFLTACQPDAETSAPQARPVRTVTVVKRDVGETVSYIGRIEAEDEARLAFRVRRQSF
jgi:membrane fusion protein, multidrug efflux system